MPPFNWNMQNSAFPEYWGDQVAPVVPQPQPVAQQWDALYGNLADFGKPNNGTTGYASLGGGIASPNGGGVPGASSATWFDNIDPKTGLKTQGMLNTGVGVASGLFNAWMGMKQYGLAKETLAQGKREFNLNYDAQRRTTNASLEDRQRARVASNPGGYQSVGGYMAKNGIQGG